MRDQFASRDGDDIVITEIDLGPVPADGPLDYEIEPQEGDHTPSAPTKFDPFDVEFVHLLAGRARALRYAHPTGYLVASLDLMYSPMRAVAFDDMHRDGCCENPIVFADLAEATRVANAWNARLAPQFMPALAIGAFAIDGWHEAFLGTLDPSILYAEDA